MPRAHFYRPITNEKGDLIIDATVQVLDPVTETSYTGSIYSAEEGTDLLANPFVSEDGILDFYLDQPQVVDLRITTVSGAVKLARNMPVTGLTSAEVDLAAVIAAAEQATAAAEAAAAAAQGAQSLDDLEDVNAPTPPNAGDVMVGNSGGTYDIVAGASRFDLAGAAAAAEQAAKQASQPFNTHLTAIAALTTTPYGRSLLTLANSDSLATQVPVATDLAAGRVELATTTETTTGTDTTRAVTPAGVAAAIAGKANTSSLGPLATSTNAALLTGTLPSSVLPPLAVNETFTPATQAAMLALTAQRGDIAIRTDNGKTYVLSTDSPGTLADWKEIVASGAVQSVAGKTGVVSLVKADVGLANVDNTSDANKPISTAVQTALNGKEPTIAVGTTAQYWRGDKTFQALDKAAVGLSAVDNTADTAKPVSTAQQAALDGKADKVSGLVPVAQIPTLDSAKVGTGRLAALAPAVTNLNNAKDSGWYSAVSGSTNLPQTGNHLVEVIAFDANNAVQTAYPYSGAGATDQKRWRRYLTAGAWGSWFRIEEAQSALDARYYTKAQTDTEIAEAFNAALMVGELGYAARTTSFTTTNTTNYSVAAASIIGAFSVTVVGEGDPVDIDFQTLAAHSVGDTSVVCYLIVNGSASGTIQAASRVYSKNGSQPMGLSMTRRPILANGTSYTFQVGIAGSAAGTVTLSATTEIPMELKVTRR